MAMYGPQWIKNTRISNELAAQFLSLWTYAKKPGPAQHFTRVSGALYFAGKAQTLWESANRNRLRAPRNSNSLNNLRRQPKTYILGHYLNFFDVGISVLTQIIDHVFHQHFGC